VFDTAQAAWAPDSTRISDFTYRQVVNAAYGILDARRGKFLVQGGIRVEHATTHFHLLTTGATYENPYNSVFPSGLIAYNLDDTHQVKLSYSTRIRRPDDTDLLDPTAHYLDPLNISRGNPYLKPEYIHALELGLQRTADRLTLQLTPFFRHNGRCRPHDPDTRHGRRADADVCQRLDQRRVWRRLHDRQKWWSTQRVRGGERVPADQQRIESRAGSLGQDLRMDGPDKRHVPSHEYLRSPGAGVVSGADDGRAGPERQPHAVHACRTQEAHGRQAERNAACDRPVQHVA